jgi:DNA-binding transcriptional ArsR family regulator
LNAGPGAIAGCFVHERHFTSSPTRLSGWWGHDPKTRFQMLPEFRPAAGAAGWAVSNPPIFSAAPLLASLEMFREADMSEHPPEEMELHRPVGAVRCVRCDWPVEHARRVYAVPTCYKCLPPPPALPISRPAVSRHLRLLKEAGLVIEEPRGTRRIYRLHDEGVAAVRGYLERVWGEAAARFRLVAENTTPER